MITPIISSLLDTDLYKLTMMQCAYHQFPSTPVGYRLILRKPVDLRAYIPLIQEQIEYLCQLKFQESELAYLASLGYFKTDFLDFLRTFSLSSDAITLFDNGHTLELTIEGNWVDTILFEVPLLALISEIFYQNQYPNFSLSEGEKRLQKKIEYFKHHAPDLHFIEFGTRRRYSRNWQEYVLNTLHLQLPNQCYGTSNLYFAHQFHLPPIGTMAHEYLQACQVLAPQLMGSQQFALNTWLKEYPSQLGIALTDSLTMDVFLKEFDDDLTKRYQGLRQDSGDPIIWGEKALAHYRTHQIDAKEKTFVFSDNLNPEKANAIFQHFKNQIHMLFGIGTNLTNDVGLTSLDVVLKMYHTHQQPVIKITDSPGKTVCDSPEYLQYVKTLFSL